jgi:hypothetical protein
VRRLSPLAPDPQDPVVYAAERLRVPGDPVVPAVPAQLAEKLCLLPACGRMPVVLTPLVELPQEPGNPVGSRLALHHPSTPPRPLPEVGETEKVKTPRLLGRLRSSLPLLTAGLFETHQTGLVGMEAQPVLTESLRQYLQDPPSIALQLDNQDKVVGKADQESLPVQPGCPASTRIEGRVASLANVTRSGRALFEVDYSSPSPPPWPAGCGKRVAFSKGCGRVPGDRAGAAAFHTPSDWRPG